MLVLSRRPQQKIVFPTLNIALNIIRVQGNVVRIGIEAPPEFPILREELLGGAPGISAKPSTGSEHALNNALNKVCLTLHLAQHHLDAGQLPEVESLLTRTLETLETLAQERAAKADQRPGKSVNPKRYRTLIVEDDHNERELLAGILRMKGCECDAVEDGEAALAYLAQHPQPDFLLLDMRMPRCDGPQMLGRLRPEGNYDSMRIFAVTGSGPDEMEGVAGTRGIDGWFRKPLNPRLLWDAMCKSTTSPVGNN